MNIVNLQDYFAHHIAKQRIDHRIRVEETTGTHGEPSFRFYIHPLGVDGTTASFELLGSVTRLRQVFSGEEVRELGTFSPHSALKEKTDDLIEVAQRVSDLFVGSYEPMFHGAMLQMRAALAALSSDKASACK